MWNFANVAGYGFSGWSCGCFETNGVWGFPAWQYVFLLYVFLLYRILCRDFYTFLIATTGCEVLDRIRSDGHIFRVYNLGIAYITFDTSEMKWKLCDWNPCISHKGTGRGYSVLEMVSAMEKTCGHKLATKMGLRRPGQTKYDWSRSLCRLIILWFGAGDIATCYANAEAANRDLGWTAHRSLDEMCTGKRCFVQQCGHFSHANGLIQICGDGKWWTLMVLILPLKFSVCFWQNLKRSALHYFSPTTCLCWSR